jgi:hypothetical protein
MDSISHEIPQPLPVNKRPVLLTIICLFGWVYFFVLSSLFLLGLLRSGWVTEALNLYAPVSLYSKTTVTLILGINALLHILAFSGIIIMWNLRKYGYYIFGGSVLVIAFYQLYMPHVAFSATFIYIVLLVLFGLYFRRFR